MLDFVNNKTNMVNIICALLLVALIVILIVCLVRNKDNFGEERNNNEDLNKVENDLNGKNNKPEDKTDNNINKNEIILIGYMSCPFCKKAKDLMDEMQLDYKFIESNSPEGKKNMEQYDSNGVPLIIDLRMNIVIKGFNAEKIKQLKN